MIGTSPTSPTQHECMKLLDEHQPEEVFLSPTCGPWSPMQNINAKTPQRQEQLQQLRDWHHRVHMRFCRRIYLKQVHEGRHAHLEQPTPALSWRTSALSTLPGHRAKFSQCQYGAMCKNARRAMAASPKRHNSFDDEAGRGPSHESTMPWRSSTYAVLKAHFVDFQGASHNLHGELPARYGINSCGSYGNT